MADRKNPEKHEDNRTRVQPLSPQHRGIDPLAEGGKLLPKNQTDTEPTEKKTNKAESAPKTETTVQPDENGEVTNPPKSNPEKSAKTSDKK